MQRGFTLLEIAAALVILGVFAALIGPRVNSWSDRIAVGRAMEDFRSVYLKARMAAIYGSVRVRVVISSDSLVAVAETGPSVAENATDSVLFRIRGPNYHGVSMVATRNLIRFYPIGIGLGGSNTKIVLRRGVAAESLTVSRLGRLKRWP
jgi:prepilin-type N-terminal cleavage/methylation domain-containing protein